MTAALRPAVFLDRDGVINRCFVRGSTPYPPQTLNELELLPGVVEAANELHRLGLPLIVVTNQPDVARGTQKVEVVEAINAAIREQLPLTAIYTCLHDNADACDCRKPKPGMLLRAAKEHGIDLSRSFMVGDRAGDVLAGKAAGCKTFLINRSYSQRERCAPDWEIADLSEAARRIAALIAAG